MRFYNDSRARYENDAEFHALVDMLRAYATTNGYTPGELKQAAFYASFLVELHTSRPIQVSADELLAFREWQERNKS